MGKDPHVERVLVVDDLDAMRTLISRTLMLHGFLVDDAATLAEARQMYPARYDAILVDAHLGPERGTDLIEAVLAEDPAAASRCLMITGGNPGLLPDGVACLAKPFRPTQLLAAVRALHRPAISTPSSPRSRVSGIKPPPGAAPPAPRTPEATRPDPPSAGPSAPRAPGPARPHRPGADPLRRRMPEAARPTLRRSTGLPVPPATGPARPHPPTACSSCWPLLRLARGLRAQDRDDVADLLHDGPIQELAAAALSLQMVRGSPPGDAGQFDAVGQQLDAASRALRWLIDTRLPLPEPGTGLAAAVRQQVAWLAVAPVTVDTRGLPDALDAAAVAALVDVAELVLAALVTGGRAARAHIALSAKDCLTWAEVDLASTGDGAAAGNTAARAALADLTSALGSTAWTDFRGQRRCARVALPGWLGVPARAVTDPG